MPRRTLPAALIASVVAMCIMHASDAGACGMAYPAGSFVHMQNEQTLVVWDEKGKTEHFVRKPKFDGDPESFGFFVPTPVVPKVGKADAAMFERLRDLVEPPPPKNAAIAMRGGGDGKGAPGGHVDVMQTVKIDDYELVSLKASDEQALGEWLGKHGFVDRTALRDWAKDYVERGWIINAMRYAGTKEKAKTSLETPAVRFSFAIEEPFYPYSEPPDEPSDLQAFRARHGGRYTPRALDVWLVARKSMFAPEATQAWGGLQVRSSTRVGAALLGDALGDTKDWGFATSAEDSWVVTHLSDPKAPEDQIASVEKAKDKAKKPHRWRKLALGGLALALALGVLYALRLGSSSGKDEEKTVD
jgi:hypothetical protein